MACPSIGNSLTSISSLTTLPPSPHLRPRHSEHGPRHPLPTPSAPVNLPSDNSSEQSSPSSDLEIGSDQPAFSPAPITGSGLGSVPSPRPRFAHLTSSAPTRPRIPRSFSSSSVRMPSPLNPASQKTSTKAKKIGSRHEVSRTDLVTFGGSVPQTRPNGLFTSKLGSAPLPEIAVGDDNRVAPPKTVGVNISKTGEGDGEVELSRSESRHAEPVRITGRTTPPQDDEDDSCSPRAPNSFSTFVELMFRPRPVSLIPIDRRRGSAKSDTISDLVL